MSSFTKTLPKTWELTTLGEAYQVIGGGTPSTDVSDCWGGDTIYAWNNAATSAPSTDVSDCWGGDTPWITSADIEGVRQINVRKYVTEKGISESTTNKVPPKTLLVVTRVGLGKIAIAETSICFSQDLQGLIQNPELICPEYTLYLLSYELQFLKFNGRGTTISGVTKKQLKDLIFPLPPLVEQHRIVTKIEELFSELDKGIENLKTARAQLKVYRQALLKHAFEGKLTAQWREENKDKLETAEALLKRIQTERGQRYQQQLADWEAGGKQSGKPKAPKTLPPLTAEELTELPELPDDWKTVLIDSLLSLEKKPMATGPFGTLLNKNDHKPSGIPVLGIENIGNGVFVDGNKIFVSELKATELDSFRVEAGDIIISRSGTVGEICKIPKGLGKAFISTNLIRISLNGNVINPDYFVYLFQGVGSVKQQVKRLCKGSSREFLNQGILTAIAFPLPSIEEQGQIVAVIDAKFSIIEELENTIEEDLQKSEALRQSILKKAFSGQLVPQDPHDEPASALLARIKAEKSANSNNKKVRA